MRTLRQPLDPLRRGVPFAVLLTIVSSLAAARAGETPETPAQTETVKDPYALPKGAVGRLGEVHLWLPWGVTSAVFFPDSKSVILGGRFDHETHHLAVWDVATGRITKRLDKVPLEKGDIHALALCPKGRYLAVAVHDSVVLYDLEAEKLLARKKVNYSYSLAFSPDGKVLAAGTHYAVQGACPIHLWNVTTGAEKGSLPGHGTSVNGLRFSADGKRLVSSSPTRDVGSNAVAGFIAEWDWKKGEMVRYRASASSAVAFAPDLSHYVFQGATDIFRVDLESPKKPIKLPVPWLTFFIYSADGKYLAAGGNEDVVHLLEGQSGHLVRKFSGPVLRGARPLAFSPDNKILATIGPTTSASGNVRLWDVDTGRDITPLSGHQEPVTVIAFADDKTLFSAGEDGAVIAWDLATRKVIRRFEGNEKPVRALALAVGKARVAACTGKTIQVWDRGTGQKLRCLEAPPEPEVSEEILGVAFIERGNKMLYVETDGRVRCWDLQTGRTSPSFVVSPKVTRTLFLADGRILATAHGDSNGYRVEVWQVEARKRLWAWDFPSTDESLPRREIDGIALSPDGRFLAVSETPFIRDAEGTHFLRTVLTIWELSTGQRIARMPRQEVGSRLLAFSPDNLWLACEHGKRRPEPNRLPYVELVSREGVILRDLTHSPLPIVSKTRDKPPAPLRPLPRRYQENAVAFSPDGKRLATAGSDRTIVLWDPDAFRGSRAVPAPLTANELVTLWDEIGQASNFNTLANLHRLAGDPDSALPFLKEKLGPASKPDANKISQWIADLDSGQFRVRAEATKELASLGDVAEPAMLQARAKASSLEVQRRLDTLLENVRVQPHQVRAHRATLLLEWIGNDEARRLLDVLAGGAEESRITQEAQRSLKRLADR